MEYKRLRNRFTQISCLAIFAVFLFASVPSFGQARVIEVLADKDSHFKIAGMSHPEITVKAGEPLLCASTRAKGRPGIVMHSPWLYPAAGQRPSASLPDGTWS